RWSGAGRQLAGRWVRGPVGPGDGQERSRLDRERHVDERRPVAVSGRDAIDDDGWRTGGAEIGGDTGSLGDSLPWQDRAELVGRHDSAFTISSTFRRISPRYVPAGP